MGANSPNTAGRVVVAIIALLATTAAASGQTLIQPAPPEIDWTILIHENASISCSGPRRYFEQSLGEIGMDGNVRGNDNTLMQTWLRTVPQARAVGDQLRAALHQRYLQDVDYRTGICRIVGRAPGIEIIVTDRWSRPPMVTTRRFNDPIAAGGYIMRVIDFGKSRGLVPPALVPVRGAAAPPGGLGVATASNLAPSIGTAVADGPDSADVLDLTMLVLSCSVPSDEPGGPPVSDMPYPEPETEYFPNAEGFVPRPESLPLFFQLVEELRRLAEPR